MSTTTTTAAVELARPSVTVRRRAAGALRAGATHYTDRAGVPEVRRAIATWLGGPTGIESERVIVTSGREESLFLALCALIDRGTALIVVRPAAGDHELVESLGLTVRAWSPGERLPASGAGGVLVRAAPENDREELMLIAEAAADAALTALFVQPAGAATPAALELADRAVIAGDFDEAGLLHWGAGYLVGPPELIEPLIELKQGLNICTAGFAQHAAAAVADELLHRSGCERSAGRSPVRARRSSLAGSSVTARRSVPVSVSDEGTRQRYELLDLLAATPAAITLGRGDPDLATPAPIVAAAIAAMDRPVRAVDPRGEPALREAIASKLARENGVLADADSEVLVTTGGQEAIFLLLQALLQPGDEVLMPSPRYTSYDVAINVAGARIVGVPPPGPLDFTLDAAEIEARITPHTRALLIISPGNPTAAVPGRASLEAVAEVARRHGLMVISDEMYERIVYDGATHTSVAALPGMRERTVTVGGFSKAYAMTGWRVGYLAGPPRVIESVARLKALWSGSTSVISQAAALAALTSEADLWAEHLAIYTERRALALAALDALELPHAPSEGAFYGFFEISSLGIDSYELSRRLLLEAGVFMYPGSGFGAEWNRHMRLAWLQPEPLLEEALARFSHWIRNRRCG